MDRLISEQAVLEVINNAILLGRFYCGKERTIEEIKAIPSAEPKTGHWTPYKNEADVYKCTACGAIVYEYPTSWNYCPWCRARMIKKVRNKYV